MSKRAGKNPRGAAECLVIELQRFVYPLLPPSNVGTASSGTGSRECRGGPVGSSGLLTATSGRPLNRFHAASAEAGSGKRVAAGTPSRLNDFFTCPQPALCYASALSQALTHEVCDDGQAGGEAADALSADLIGDSPQSGGIKWGCVVKRISRHYVAACLAVGISAGSSFAQAPNPKPVSKNLVRGRTLTVPQYNFSLTAPSDDWEWLQMPLTTQAKGFTYVCRQVSTGAMVGLSVFDQDDRGRPDHEVLKGLMSGPAYQTHGLKTSAPEAVRMPFPGSYRFRVAGDMGGRTVHITHYVYWTNRMYVFQGAAAEPADPEALLELMKSFKLLTPVPPKR